MFDSGFGGLTVARALIDLLPGRGPRLHRRHRALPVRAPVPRRGAALRPSRSPTSWSASTTSRWSSWRATPPPRPRLDLLRFDYDVPLIERHRARPAGGAAGHPTAAGSGSSAPSAPSVPAPTSAPSPLLRPAVPVDLTCAACPGFVEFVERGRRPRTRSTCWPSGCWLPCGPPTWTPAARLHPLPVPGPHHQRRRRARRGAGQLGRRDRVRDPRASSPTPASGGAAPNPGPRRGSRRAMRRLSVRSGAASSGPRSTASHAWDPPG